jgi:hypothetical protein
MRELRKSRAETSTIRAKSTTRAVPPETLTYSLREPQRELQRRTAA